jgi:hypothetical protein
MSDVRTVTVSLLIAAAGACGVLGLVSAGSVPGNDVVVAAAGNATADDTHWVAPAGDDDTHW